MVAAGGATTRSTLGRKTPRSDGGRLGTPDVIPLQRIPVSKYVAGVMLTWSQWLEFDWHEFVFFRRPKWKRYHPSNGGRLETLPPTDILSGVLGAAKLGD